MKKAKNYRRIILGMLIAAGGLVVLLAILLLMRTNSAIAEWMASNYSRAWISVFSRITSIFPFSLYETLLYVGIIGAIALIVIAIVFFCKKKPLRAVTYLLIILLVGLSIGNVYTVSAGFAYFRGEPDIPLHQTSFFTDDNIDEVIVAAKFMMDDYNRLASAMDRDEDGRTISPYTHAQLGDKLKEEYKRLNSQYFSSFTPRAKTITSKKIMSHMHITGVFFAPFGEANVNPLTPSMDIPVTMAHELAHSKGAMRESDANLVAYWLTITSDDEYLRYCGYSSCFSRLLFVLLDYDMNNDTKLYAELYSALDPKIKQEMRLNNEFWSSYDLLDKITDAFNDFYLKLQGQKDGTGSYVEPTIPPGIVITPGDGGGDKIEVTYYLNNVQRMILRAVEERMNSNG
ncbi:MAG: DUF3810 domain-containing protein [Clostridiales bacterium]|nr:DUF3810 domain-containing protein [Clostridiales bacterium]